jgi:hypothetical protein
MFTPLRAALRIDLLARSILLNTVFEVKLWCHLYLSTTNHWNSISIHQSTWHLSDVVIVVSVVQLLQSPAFRVNQDIYDAVVKNT